MRGTTIFFVYLGKYLVNPKSNDRYRLVFLCLVGLDGLGLDNDCRVAARERAAFGGDGARDIAGCQSQCHGNGCGNSHC